MLAGFGRSERQAVSRGVGYRMQDIDHYKGYRSCGELPFSDCKGEFYSFSNGDHKAKHGRPMDQQRYKGRVKSVDDETSLFVLEIYKGSLCPAMDLQGADYDDEALLTEKKKFADGTGNRWNTVLKLSCLQIENT